jgi:glycosyltransferase involved in cell wall biosynthesis
VLTLSRLLADAGNEVIVVTQRHSHVWHQAAAAGLTTVGLDFTRRRNTVLLAAQLARLFRRLDPAVVHAHGARAGLPAALALCASSRRLIYTVHGFHFPHKAPVSRWLARAAEAFCIARADCTAFVSDGDLTVAKTCGLLTRSRAQRVVKNAVVVDTNERDHPKTYDIGFVGRLHPQKNPLILVDILKAMRPARPSLCVIGGGELATELRARAHRAGVADQVRLCGECERSDALNLLSSCRTLVLPSRWEGHPITLIEAMHLGIPSVASDIPGNDEIVADGETGFLAPAGDAAGFAVRLARLLADDRLRGQLAAEGRRRAERDFSPARLLHGYLEIYRGGKAAAPELPA